MKNAYIGQPSDSNTTLYTCPASTTARVLSCTATNDTTTAVTITIHKVPSGDSPGDDNLILNLYSLSDKETHACPEVVGQVLEAGDSISAIAGTADQATVSLDVAEVT